MPRFREAAARIRRFHQVSQDTKLVMGDSLGLVVACEALCATLDAQVFALVALSLPMSIFDGLRRPVSEIDV